MRALVVFATFVACAVTLAILVAASGVAAPAARAAGSLPTFPVTDGSANEIRPGVAGHPELVDCQHLVVWWNAPAGQNWGLAYLAAILILYYLSNTFIDLPYKAWGADLSPNYRERSLVTGFRESYGFLGLSLVLAIPVVMTMYGLNKLADWVFAIAVATAILLPLLFLPALFGVKETEAQAKPWVPW